MLKDQIIKIISAEISEYGAEIVDVQIKGPPARRILLVYVDREGGISIDDCVNLSNHLLGFTELENLLGANYSLEVSSPGVDRPLKTSRDFERKLGKKIRVEYRDELGIHRIEGEIEEVYADHVTIRNVTDIYKVPYESIINAKQKLKW